jgi:tight adherence protein C
MLRRALRRPPDVAADRRVGVALVVGLTAAALLTLPAGVAAGAVAWGVPSVRVRRRTDSRDAAVRAVLPDVVDLFRLAVGAGLSVHQCVEVVAPRAPDPVGVVLHEVRRQVALGVRLGDALAELDDLGDAARPLTSALVGAARYGSPLTLALDRVVVDARLLRRRRAEERARRLPVQLLFPLVMCVLPAFGLLAVVPLLAGALPSLGSSSP